MAKMPNTQSTQPSPKGARPKAKLEGPFPIPPTATWQDKFLQAATTDLHLAVAAFAAKNEQVQGKTFLPMPPDAARSLARAVIYPKGLLAERTTHFDPTYLEVESTPEGDLLLLCCEVIGHTPTPYPLNERFLDDIPFMDRPKASVSTGHAGLKVTIPAGKTIEQVFRQANEKLRVLDDDRDYKLMEDLRRYGQLRPGLSVAVEFDFEDATDMDARFRAEEARIEAEPDPSLQAEMRGRLDEAKLYFQNNLSTLCQFTGNNRAMRIRESYGTEDHHYITGFQEKFLLQGGKGSTLNLERAYRQYGAALNQAFRNTADENHQHAKDLLRLAKVPTRVVVGVENPSRLMACLRCVNNRDHGRPPLPFKDQAKARSQSKEVVALFAAQGYLKTILTQACTSPVSTLLGVAGGMDLLESVLTGDTPWQALLPHVQTQTPAIDLLDLEIALLDLVRAIFLPDFIEGQEAIRTVLLEQPRTQLTAADGSKRMAVMMAVVSGILGVEINDSAFEGVLPVVAFRQGVAHPVKPISTHLSLGQNDEAEFKDLWRFRLFPYLLAAKLVWSAAGSSKDRRFTYPTSEGEMHEVSLVRRAPTDALQSLLQPAIKAHAIKLACNLLEARRKYLAGESSAFGIEPFQVPYDRVPLPKVADKAWFDRVFQKLQRNGAKSANPTGLVDPPDPQEEMVRSRRDYLNVLHDSAQVARQVLDGFEFPSLHILEAALDDLQAAAQALANAKGSQVFPLTPDDANDADQAILAARHYLQTVSIKDFNTRLKEFLDSLTQAISAATQVAKPSTDFNQPGGLQELEVEL